MSEERIRAKLSLIGISDTQITMATGFQICYVGYIFIWNILTGLSYFKCIVIGEGDQVVLTWIESILGYKNKILQNSSLLKHRCEPVHPQILLQALCIIPLPSFYPDVGYPYLEETSPSTFTSRCFFSPLKPINVNPISIYNGSEGRSCSLFVGQWGLHRGALLVPLEREEECVCVSLFVSMLSLCMHAYTVGHSLWPVASFLSPGPTSLW